MFDQKVIGCASTTLRDWHKKILTRATFNIYSEVKPKQLVTGSYQKIIKVREWTPHIGPLTEVFPLKLFLDIVPSSSADITRAMRECFGDGSVYIMSFRFVPFQSKGKHPTLRRCNVFFDK